MEPGVVAKMISTLDQISHGRAAVNVVSGWFKGEFHAFGEPWLDHDERYRRSEEFICVLKQMWSEEETVFRGDFYRINGGALCRSGVAGTAGDVGEFRFCESRAVQ
jgi:dimethylsulfone monooxygenase